MTHEQAIRYLCDFHNLGVRLDYLGNDTVQFSYPLPIKQKIQQLFPSFELQDSGYGPLMEDRPDDQREFYWVKGKFRFITPKSKQRQLHAV